MKPLLSYRLIVQENVLRGNAGMNITALQDVLKQFFLPAESTAVLFSAASLSLHLC